MQSGLLQQSDWFAADWTWFWPVSGQADGNTCTSPGSSGSWCNPYKQWRCYRWCQSLGCRRGERSGNPFLLSHSFPAETPGTPLKGIEKQINGDSTSFARTLRCINTSSLSGLCSFWEEEEEEEQVEVEEEEEELWAAMGGLPGTRTWVLGRLSVWTRFIPWPRGVT